MTSYRKDGIMLVTQQVTCGAKGGGDYGKCEPVEILHGKGRIYAERAGKIARNLCQTLTRKLKKRVFGTDEAAKIVELLCIDDPKAVFFGE